MKKPPLTKQPKKVRRIKLGQVIIRLIITLLLFSALLFLWLSKSGRKLREQGLAGNLKNADFQNLEKEIEENSRRALEKLDESSTKGKDGHSVSEPLRSELNLLFAGDVLLHEPIVNQGFGFNPSPDYSWLFKHVKEVVEEADFSFANMEGTLTEEPYAGYPMFRAPGVVAKNLKEAGFDVIYTANNHCLDGGTEGVFSTLEYLRDAGLKTVGTRMNNEEKPYLLLEKNGIKLAVSTYTYETIRQYNVPNINTIPVPNALLGLIDSFSTEEGDGINYGFSVDASALKERVERMKSVEPDILIFVMHWGTEYATAADLVQEFYGKILAESGVHLIIGMHPLYMYKSYPGYPEANCTYGWALPVELALLDPVKYEAENLVTRLEEALDSSRNILGQPLDFSESYTQVVEN